MGPDTLNNICYNLHTTDPVPLRACVPHAGNIRGMTYFIIGNINSQSLSVWDKRCIFASRDSNAVGKTTLFQVVYNKAYYSYIR